VCDFAQKRHEICGNQSRNLCVISLLGLFAGGLEHRVGAKDFLAEAAVTRERARALRLIAVGLSLRDHERLILEQAEELERQAARLEAAAVSGQ
jgi:hypothetical protein